MISRKGFLKQASMLSAAFALAPSCMAGSSNSIANKNVGLQLYSLRDQIGKDVAGVIEKVAKAGYLEVETYGYDAKNLFWGMKPAEFNNLLKSNGLTSPSGHYDVGSAFAKNASEDDLKRTLDTYAEAALGIGQKDIIVPWIAPEISATADDYKRVSEKLNWAGEEIKKSKLSIGYHNHAFEFEDRGGRTGYDILLTETDPKLVNMEVDLYWVVRSGNDPIKLFKEYPGRFSLWHVKDMDKQQPDLNTEIGNGSIDYRPIFKEAKLAGLKTLYVEQENFAIDPFQSIGKSVNYIKNSLLKDN